MGRRLSSPHYAEVLRTEERHQVRSSPSVSRFRFNAGRHEEQRSRVFPWLSQIPDLEFAEPSGERENSRSVDQKSIRRGPLHVMIIVFWPLSQGSGQGSEHSDSTRETDHTKRKRFPRGHQIMLGRPGAITIKRCGSRRPFIPTCFAGLSQQSCVATTEVPQEYSFEVSIKDVRQPFTG